MRSPLKRYSSFCLLAASIQLFLVVGKSWSQTRFASGASDHEGTKVGLARNSIQKLYNRFDDYYLQGNFVGIEALATPDARYLDEIRTTDCPLTDQIEFWKAVRASGTKFKFQPASLTSVHLSGTDVVVTVRREFERFEPNSLEPLHLVAFRRDDWTQTANGWKLKDYVVVGEFSRPANQPSALAVADMKNIGENLDFAEGSVGEFPVGWKFGSRHSNVSTAAIESPAACRYTSQCARIVSSDASPGQVAFLYQVADVRQYRGRKFRLRAEISADVSGYPNAARLLARIHTVTGATNFRDDMGRTPITSAAWELYEVDGEVGPDANDLEFGVQLVGSGTARVQRISLELQ